MLVVKIELHSAVTGEVTTIGKAIVHNVGGTSERGDYEALVARKGDVDLNKIMRTPLRTGRVNDYPRKSYNVWRLISRAIRSAFPEEK